MDLAHLGWYLNTEVQNFFQAWWRRFCEISLDWDDFGWFLNIEFQFFFHHGEGSPKKYWWIWLILGDFWTTNLKLQKFREISYVFFHLGWFHNIRHQNFIQPWWRKFKEISMDLAHFGWLLNTEVHFFFKHGEGGSEKYQWIWLILGDF